MPMQERVQLARAIAEKQGRRMADVEDWLPLLRFTQGNPLTLTVLVGQALRDGLRTKAQVEAFVNELRSGEAKFEDEVSEGRAKSLGASLSYGFENTFSDAERRQLALLYYFQGFVNVDVLRLMGDPVAPWCLREVRGLTREDGIRLLDRAADIGLLTAQGAGYYSIHPALPWFFKFLFVQHYPVGLEPLESAELRASRAFVGAMGYLGGLYHRVYDEGNRDVIAALSQEESNLLYARRLSRIFGWWRPLTSTMQGLDTLYEHTGRRVEWAALVVEIAPDFIDSATNGPLAGREEQWAIITEYRIVVAERERQWALAQNLHDVQIDLSRRRAESALSAAPNALDAVQRNRIRTLAVTLHQRGQFQRKLGKPDCVSSFEESLKLLDQIDDKALAAVCAYNLGGVFEGIEIPALENLDSAEHWYRCSLELQNDRDHIGRARCLSQLGFIACRRFQEARETKQPEPVLLNHINAAANFYYEALDLLPPNAVEDLASLHNQLGNLYGESGYTEEALQLWRESIRYKEMSGNLYGVATTRYNVAIGLAQAGRLADAREYALAALRNYQMFGDGASADVQKTQSLLQKVEELIGKHDLP